jgi:hypothetical protein
MIFVRRKRFVKKPKDILALALKNLWPGEELLCTKATYDAIAERVDAFRAIQTDRRLATIAWGEVRKIRRVM